MPETLTAQQEPPRPQPHRERDNSSWMVGVVLILLGLAFFLQNAGIATFAGNWWAIFIYLAAFASLANAWRAYRAHGQWGSSATGSLVWGLVLTVVATILLFNLSWDRWWPAILMAVGTGIVVGSVIGGRAREPQDTNAE